jgi:lactoylglutathione lyase
VRQWGGEVVKLRSPADAQYQHFCLEIEGLEALRESLVGHGIAVTEIAVGMDGSKQCWIKDPDGNSIELMEYTPRSLQIQD